MENNKMEQTTQDTETNKDMPMHVNIRLPTQEKIYYLNQLQQFANTFNKNKIMSVSFGKQDTRGSVSITFFDLRHCVPFQKFFYNKYELLGYVCGFNASKYIKDQYDEYNRFV
jgi:hypothetical protein